VLGPPDPGTPIATNRSGPPLCGGAVVPENERLLSPEDDSFSSGDRSPFNPCNRTAHRIVVVTCVGLAVKALVAYCSGPEVFVKVERPQRSEDVRP